MLFLLGFEKRLPLVIGRTPDLGLLITLLYRSASEFLSSLDDQKAINRRLQSLATLTSDELSEVLFYYFLVVLFKERDSVILS